MKKIEGAESEKRGLSELAVTNLEEAEGMLMERPPDIRICL